MQQYEEEDYTKRFDLSLWVKLIKHARAYSHYLIGIACCMLICALADVLYPQFTRYAIDNFISRGTTDGLMGFCALYVAVVLVQTAAIFTFIRLSGRVEIFLCHQLRREGFALLQAQPFSYYDQRPVGQLMARMTSDVNRLGETVGWGLVDLLWASGFVLFSSASMLMLNWQLALTVMLVLPPLVLIAMYFQKRILTSYRVVRKTNSKITGSFNEGIMGAKTTKTLVREDANFEEFRVLTGNMRASAIRAAVLSALFMPIVISLGSVGVSHALFRGSSLVAIGGMTVGTLSAFISYTSQFFEPVREIARIFADLQSSQAAAERVFTLLETKPEIEDAAEVIAKYGDNFHPKRENWEPIHGDIEFRNVSFQYNKGERVLEDFNLTVKAGETIALVGETGSGKSTLVNLVCRFYEPTKGELLIDGVDYRKRSQLWLQSNLGYVLQQPHLFSGTVRENIRYGRLDASDEDVVRAAQLVNAEEFILKLEKGYDTDVGEGGNRLSTGEKQLVSFARALIARPALFVLDEATSSVDTETEQKIQQAIQTALSGRTSFIIAHRLSTVRSADRILVMQHGKITEQGSHKELLRMKGYYYNLYTNQFRDEQELHALGMQLTEVAE